MNLKKVSRIATRVGLLGLLMMLTACSANKVVLHPIEKSDIVSVLKDETFTAPKDGWFLSDFYVEKVMKAKVSE